MLTRRNFLFTASAAAVSCSRPQLTPRERIDRVIAGQEPDRPPFSFWYHFGLENLPGARHAAATLEFHRKFRTDLVKVMSDFAFPKPEGEWHAVTVLDDPYPEQIRALEIIRDGLAGSAHFVETIFNPWNVAEKLSSKEEVARLKGEDPERLLATLEAIARSEANHAKKAIATGASGVFVAIANADETSLSREDYLKFSQPFDKMIFDAVADAPLNTLHLHGDKVYLDLFYSGWNAPVYHHASHATGVPIAEVRKNFNGIVMGGWDYRNILQLTDDELRQQAATARAEAGAKFILAPGCSAPDDSPDADLLRISGIAEAM
jgi:uroporphyrinogen decarboxylase